MSIFIFVTALQGLAILFDEFVFHHRRGLPRWERLGHPLDTASVIACLLFLVFVDRTPTTEIIYYFLAGASCLLVTKDEWIHRKLCSSEEMWLHAVLFILHPLILFAAMAEWETSRPIIFAMSGGVFVFMIYQIVYWNFIEARSLKAKQVTHYARAKQDDLYEYFGE